jgi:hypothetical protein
MNQVSLKFDQGYGKINLLLKIGTKGYHMSTIACKKGSHYQFITWNDADEYISRLQRSNDEEKEEKIKSFEDFILDDSKTEGAQVTRETKEYKLGDSDGAKCTVYAFCFCSKRYFRLERPSGRFAVLQH